MEDIVKEIRDIKMVGGWKAQQKSFRKESMVDREYFVNVEINDVENHYTLFLRSRTRRDCNR